MTIKLHIGAHKTATTHIQSLLEANQKILQDNHITLSTPSTLRKNWLSNFLKFTHNQEKNLGETLNEKAPSNGIWLISEENFSGIPYDFKINHTGIYPNLKARLQAFKKLFPNDKIELFFSIRSYDTYYRSLYLEVVRNNGYIPFNDFYKEDKFIHYSWVNVIESFTEVFNEQDITVWCYENISSIMPKIINRLTETKEYETYKKNYPINQTRVSLSKQAIETLASYSTISQEESKQMVQTVYQQYSLEKGFQPYEPFDKNIQEFYQKKYSQDINFIKNKFLKINFLQG